MGRYHFVFPTWTNLILPAAIVFGATAPIYAVYIVAFGLSAQTLNTNYRPEQPIPFSHKIHAGELGIDCEYCHTSVKESSHSVIPPTSTCMNCHRQIHKDSEKLAPLRESWEQGTPVKWVRIHDLADYAYFNHSAHVTRGVSCVSCHGRVDQMEIVHQEERLSMGWCLECHRNPEPHLRDPALVTDLGWKFKGTKKEEKLYHEWWSNVNQINPSQDCSTCHR